MTSGIRIPSYQLIKFLIPLRWKLLQAIQRLLQLTCHIFFSNNLKTIRLNIYSLSNNHVRRLFWYLSKLVPNQAAQPKLVKFKWKNVLQLDRVYS